LQQGSGRLGETLRFWNALSEDDLNRALAAQKTRYRPLGLMLLDLGATDDEHLSEAFAERFETYASMFDPFQIESGVRDLLTMDEARRFGAVPLRRQGGSLDVAVAEPMPAVLRQEMERLLGRRGVKGVRVLFAPLSDVAFALRFAWTQDPFTQVRARLDQMRRRGDMDASREALLWRSVRAGYVRLGDLMVRDGTVSHADLQSALETARRNGRHLGETLVAMKLASRAAVDAALARQKSATWVNDALAQALAQAPADDFHPVT
jgi:hypothetical protein